MDKDLMELCKASQDGRLKKNMDKVTKDEKRIAVIINQTLDHFGLEIKVWKREYFGSGGEKEAVERLAHEIAQKAKGVDELMPTNVDKILENQAGIDGNPRVSITQAKSQLYTWIENNLPPIKGYSPEATKILKQYRDKVLEGLTRKE